MASIPVVFMFAILLFFFAFAIASSFNTPIQAQRTLLGCPTNFTSMSYNYKVVCVVTDLYSPLFISLIVALGGALIAIKLS